MSCQRGGGESISLNKHDFIPKYKARLKTDVRRIEKTNKAGSGFYVGKFTHLLFGAMLM